MSEMERIDLVRDPVLDAALRDLFDDPAREAGVLSGLGERLRLERRRTGFDVLAGWAAPGLAAALLLAAGLGLWLTLSTAQAPPVEEALAPTGDALIAAAVGTK